MRPKRASRLLAEGGPAPISNFAEMTYTEVVRNTKESRNGLDI